ncbi:hypothetical protein HOD83_02885 [Candidatus Woesearchaeota archaeon]|nr:hypothetical protein [Candidatus Woesearchaeota archaeon]MBT4248507.1 hypothetical protein [Candidatus Woesearchaeota archaeon]
MEAAIAKEITRDALSDCNVAQWPRVFAETLDRLIADNSSRFGVMDSDLSYKGYLLQMRSVFFEEGTAPFSTLVNLRKKYLVDHYYLQRHRESASNTKFTREFLWTLGAKVVVHIDQMNFG